MFTESSLVNLKDRITENLIQTFRGREGHDLGDYSPLQVEMAVDAVHAHVSGLFSEYFLKYTPQSTEPVSKMEEVSNTEHLYTLLANHDRPASIHWQVAGEDGSAWNLGASALWLDNQRLHIVLTHPQLMTLPTAAFAPDDNDNIDPNSHNAQIDSIITQLEALKI